MRAGLGEPPRTGSTAAGIEGLASLAGALSAPPAGVDQEIDPADVMYTHGRRQLYFEIGASALRAVKLALLAAGKQEPRRILDFPCGHGRVLRMLKAAFPDAALTAGDLDHPAVDFCQRKFGAAPIYSSLHPDEVELAGRFDLVWCGSLLTHLDRDRWDGFFSLLADCVANEGVFVFTAFGRHPANRIRSGETIYGLRADGGRETILHGFDREGFGYSDYEGETLSGMSLTSPAWICGRIADTGFLQCVLYMERGWFGHQDVIAVSRVQ